MFNFFPFGQGLDHKKKHCVLPESLVSQGSKATLQSPSGAESPGVISGLQVIYYTTYQPLIALWTENGSINVIIICRPRASTAITLPRGAVPVSWRELKSSSILQVALTFSSGVCMVSLPTLPKPCLLMHC